MLAYKQDRAIFDNSSRMTEALRSLLIWPFMIERATRKLDLAENNDTRYTAQVHLCRYKADELNKILFDAHFLFGQFPC